MKMKSVFQLLIVVAFFMLALTFLQPPAPEKPAVMDYSDLVTLLLQQPTSVKSITITNGTNEVTVERDKEKPAHVVLPGKAGEQSVIEAANKAHVKVIAKEPEQPGILSTILGFLLNPFVLILIFYFWMMSKQAGGPLNQMKRFQQSGGNEFQPSAEKKTFADVAGCTEAKAELQEVVEYLRDPASFKEMGAALPRGILLVGGPGNGKTLLAKAVAGEAGVPFFAMSASSFVEMFVGVGASRARDLFDKARKKMPSIIFIDEIDAVGRHRGAGIGGGHDEREQTLNEILVQMDGFTENEAIVVIAATNRPDILDPAIVRAGRFDRHVTVDSPDMIGRADIFKIHTRNRPLAEGVDLKVLAGITPGFSGADIANACNEAAVVARRRRQAKIKEMQAAGASTAEVAGLPKTITMEDFSEGIDRAMMGPARPRIMSLDDKKNTAVHEVGHAGVGHDLKGDPIRKVTIMPRARALGFTLSLPEGERFNRTREELLNELASMMGGRVAQEVILGVVDTGASNDFEQATNLARRMVTKFGMSSLGHISVSDESTSPFLGRSMSAQGQSTWGPAIMDRVDEQVQAILEEAYGRAKAVVERRKDSFQRVVDRLIEKETILGAEFEELWGSPSSLDGPNQPASAE